MSENILDEIRGHMNGFLCKGKYTIGIHDEISTCDEDDVNSFFDFLGMKIMSEIVTNEYVCGYRTEKTLTASALYLKFNTNEDYVCTFYDVPTLCNLLGDKNKTILKPVYCHINDKRHVMLFIINKKTEYSVRDEF